MPPIILKKKKRSVKLDWASTDDEDEAPTKVRGKRVFNPSKLKDPDIIDDEDEDEDEEDEVKVPTKVLSIINGKPLVRHDNNRPESDEAIANKNASVFETKLKGVREAAVKHDYGEQAILVMYKAMYDMVAELIPIAEANYRKFKIDRSAYALNTYLNQLREIANDMRSVNNFESQVRQLVEMCRFQYSMIAQNMVEEADTVRRTLRDVVRDDQRIKVDDALEKLTRGQAQYLKASLDGFTDQLAKLLLEKPDTKQAKNAGRQ
jgi:hypothetical protein